MIGMATLVIKNLPDDLHARLKAQAERHRRSLTKEAITLIEQGLAPSRQRFKLPSPLRLADGYRPTIEDIEAAIADGRDRPIGEKPSSLTFTRAGEAPRTQPWKEFKNRLQRQPDGSYVNPAGIEDDTFFETLEAIRAENRGLKPRDPFST